jgi:hypothetical protein
LIPALRALPGLLHYYSAIDHQSASMVNVSIWETEEHARAMGSLAPMLQLRSVFEAHCKWAGRRWSTRRLSFSSIWGWSRRLARPIGALSRSVCASVSGTVTTRQRRGKRRRLPQLAARRVGRPAPDPHPLERVSYAHLVHFTTNFFIEG